MGSLCLGFMFLKFAFVKSISGRSLLLLLLMEYTKLTARRCLFRKDDVVPPPAKPPPIVFISPRTAWFVGSFFLLGLVAHSSRCSSVLLASFDICSNSSVFPACLDEMSQMTCLYEFFNLVFQGPTISRRVPKVAVVPTMLGLMRTLRGGSFAWCFKKIGTKGFFHDSRPFGRQGV